jgi:hypothetical protein
MTSSIGGQLLDGQDASKIHTSVELYPHSSGLGESVPAWVAFDRKVSFPKEQFFWY